MKKYIVTILLTTIMNFAFGQAEKVAYKTVAGDFERNYNEDNFIHYYHDNGIS